SAHAPLERFDLRQGRPRDDDKRYVALRQVNDRAVQMIGKERTTWASCFPAGAEHEVINDQLAFATEQVAQRSFAVRCVEHVVLLNFLPWQFTALAGELVAGAAKGLLLSEISLARGDPLLVRNDLVLVFFHLFSPLNRGSCDAPQVWNPQRRDRRQYQSVGVIQPMPAPPGSCKMADAANIGNVEHWFHELGAGSDCFF